VLLDHFILVEPIELPQFQVFLIFGEQCYPTCRHEFVVTGEQLVQPFRFKEPVLAASVNGEPLK
jgi:hypothetical protein